MSETDFVPTRGSALKKKAADNFEVVVFESYKPKAKQAKLETQKADAGNPSKDAAFDIKKAKHEIVKFAVSGMEGSEKQEAKVRLAIRLGAKPPRNKFKNYKQLKEEKQKEKEEKKKELELRALGKDSMGMSDVKIKGSKCKKKKEKGSLLEVYGKVSKVEAAKLKRSKRK